MPNARVGGWQVGATVGHAASAAKFATSASMTKLENSAYLPKRDRRAIMIWLFCVAGLIALMVLVGGATRLTDSGLSIVEWKPVTGAIPPLSHEAWLAEFEKYKQIPEYTQVNYGMSLAAFKEIYWWEWGHRLLGRLIGLVFFVPLVVFWLRGGLTPVLRNRFLGLFVLGGLQGAMGWYMVASGLSDRVDVSQYRLAAHLSLAIILFGLILLQACALMQREPRIAVSNAAYISLLVLIGAVFAQMILGAFVAGLRAGYAFNTWPLMDGSFVPDGYFGTPARFADMFERIEAVQFNHRIGAYLLWGGALGLAYLWRTSPARVFFIAMAGAITAQALIGIWTLLAVTPLSLGLLHQAGALVVLSIGVYGAVRLTPTARG